MVARLCHNVAEDRDKWGIFAQPRTHAYNKQVHRFTGLSPFSLVRSKCPPRATTFDFLSATTSGLPGNVSPRISRNHRLARLALMRQMVDSRLTAAKKRYEENYDKCERENPVFKVNKLVFLDRPLAEGTNNSKTADKPTYKKLIPRVVGPYRIISAQQHTLTIDEKSFLNAKY